MELADVYAHPARVSPTGSGTASCQRMAVMSSKLKADFKEHAGGIPMQHSTLATLCIAIFTKHSVAQKSKLCCLVARPRLWRFCFRGISHRWRNLQVGAWLLIDCSDHSCGLYCRMKMLRNVSNSNDSGGRLNHSNTFRTSYC